MRKRNVEKGSILLFNPSHHFHFVQHILSYANFLLINFEGSRVCDESSIESLLFHYFDHIRLPYDFCNCTLIMQIFLSFNRIDCCLGIIWDGKRVSASELVLKWHSGSELSEDFLHIINLISVLCRTVVQAI